MSKSLPQRTASTHEQIAAAAQRLWEQAGRPSKRDLEFWLKAEQQVAATLRGSAGVSSAPGQAPEMLLANTASGSPTRRDRQRA